MPKSQWTVVRTHPQAERWANANIQRLGYPTYLPLYATTRRDPVLRTRKHTVLRPLFPSYLFVHLDGPWTPVRYAPGVADLLLADGNPQRVPTGVLEALRAGDASRRTLTPPSDVWAAGDPCTLVLEPFLGQPAVVIAKTGPDRLRVALLMLGAMREVTVLASSVVSRDYNSR